MRRVYLRTLFRYYSFYTGGFVMFLLALAVAEYMGMPELWIGWTFISATVLLYAGIGILSRTSDVDEFYVAGRRVPAMYNGMATGADWMSAASFIGLAGTLYQKGYDGLAFVMGWTGGYVLVALLLAPYLRKFGQFTIPDFMGARYGGPGGGNGARGVAVLGTIIASFTYVTAQVFGVGIITSRFLGIAFETGVFVGLGGILVCSFLGGMRAVTWTQVAQYIVLIIAYLMPVVFMSYKVTNVPVPQLVYGEVMQKIGEREQEIMADPAQIEVREAYAARAIAIQEKLERIDAAGPQSNVGEASRERWRREMQEAQEKARPLQPHGEAFPGETAEERDSARLNFLALTFCLMVGTAALPHILMRYYTTPSVREARESVVWSLFFISLLYFTAPAYAVFAKYEVYSNLIGSSIAELPSWVASWAKVGLVAVEDINRDGILQLAELTLNPDVIVLATPEIAGLPYVVAGLVAAGGLAAALSTADGLLLTIANALSHDVYYKMVNPQASTGRRIALAKGLLLMVAVVAAWVASLRPDTILSMVAWAFSIAGACFFPALVLGIFWKRANYQGAIVGMLTGMGLTLFYLIGVKFYDMPKWFGISDLSAGIFGIPAGFLAIVVVSLLTPPPDAATRAMVEHVRYPVARKEK
ncbi:MAG: sodium:solute symporter family protein [Pseudomonadota bacterium]|nr:sodium:solute symporter family protein [Pseudomonadota bacterium]MDP1904126.1 sodium:solute symporter family protein [Pseudomonadota bacterium]MDP2353708.1 sodium:solute symporter family protein [Pseudomonadota bacterium]